jgi:hypothetical protein
LDVDVNPSTLSIAGGAGVDGEKLTAVLSALVHQLTSGLEQVRSNHIAIT